MLRPTLTKCARIVHNNNATRTANTIRTCTHQINTPQTKPSSNWNSVYKFPSIKLLGGLNKLKIYQSAFTAVGVPVLMGLEYLLMVPAETTATFAVLGRIILVDLSNYKF